MSTTTESITETPRAFPDACETGKGWAVTKVWNVGWAMRELGWIE